MIKPLYCVRDIAGENFSPPFVARNDKEATRNFQIACQNPESNMAKWPEDYDLLQVGEFDEINGLIAPVPHRKLCGAESFVSRTSAEKDGVVHPIGRALEA